MGLSEYTRPEDRMTTERLEWLWVALNYPNNKTVYDYLVNNNRPYGTMSSRRFTKEMKKIRDKYRVKYVKIVYD